MRTIFGEENFFNKEMAKIHKAQDEVYFNEMSMAIKTYMPTIVFDREKLEKWVRLCVKLDNIDNTDLIDMATAKKFKELKDQLALTEKALELACEMLCGLSVWDKLEFDNAIKDTCEYFKTQAKEMINGKS